MAQYTEKQIARFWAKVNTNGPLPAQQPELGPCWLWTGGGNGQGYGQVRILYQQMGAHQVAWEMTQGQIPDGLYVLHKCENRGCCNPAHLYLSASKNATSDALMVNKTEGFNRGVPRRHLTKAQVKRLRQLYAGGMSKKALAEQFGVAYNTVTNIVEGKTRNR